MRWSTQEVELLRERYADTQNESLAATFGRSIQSIALKAHAIRLAKSDTFLAEHRFPKGYTPHNKGRRMEEWLSPEVHAKIKSNQARTADRNRAAAKPDGTTSRRYNGYYIKVAGRWVKLSYHVWTTNYGSVPEGYAVFYRDGDCFNSDIGNLYIDRRNDISVLTAKRTPEERREVSRKIWETRRRKRAAKHAELDAILAEIHKSNNSIYYKPNTQ